MIRFLLSLLLDQEGGLGITRVSICSAVAFDTGDSSTDAQAKIQELINRMGRRFCKITNWPFLRTGLDVALTSTDGTNIFTNSLPASYKRVVGARMLDGNSVTSPLNEVSLTRFNSLPTPTQYPGRPDEFLIRQITGDRWQLEFNRESDGAYTAKFDIEQQWTDLTADDSETVITKPYYDTFIHMVTTARLMQQGDESQYALYSREWYNPRVPKGTVLGEALRNLSSPTQRAGVIMDPNYMFPHGIRDEDYRRGLHGFTFAHGVGDFNSFFFSDAGF